MSLLSVGLKWYYGLQRTINAKSSTFLGKGRSLTLWTEQKGELSSVKKAQLVLVHLFKEGKLLINKKEKTIQRKRKGGLM